MAISGVSKNGYCTACGACVAACPFSALEMCEGVGGEPFPYVDAELCCDCGKCVAVCPSNHPASLRHPLRTYAAWSNDDEDLAKSSSAGLAAAICRHVLRRGGVAFGCVASEGSAHCAMADDEAGAEAFRGSKYVYSEPLDSYQRVRKQLRSGRRTVFVSVPCQVAALKSYLGGKPDGLLCVDLICHGTPPMSRLREHLDRACPDGWDSFSFRGERDFSMCAYKGGTLVYERSCFEDEYFLVFVTALSFRECCYECPYATSGGWIGRPSWNNHPRKCLCA